MLRLGEILYPGFIATVYGLRITLSLSLSLLSTPAKQVAMFEFKPRSHPVQL